MTAASPDPSFRFASALAARPGIRQAVLDVCARASSELGEPPDLALLFLSADAAGVAEDMAKLACQQLDTKCLIGCTAESLVGRHCEIEGQTAASLWIARLPEVRVEPVHLVFETTPDGATILGWPDSLLDGWPNEASLLLMGDPFSFPIEMLLEEANQRHPDATLVGGMSSGGVVPGNNRLFLGPQTFDHGAVGVMLSGPLRVRPLVSQGCRPIGEPLVITRAERNVVQELGGRPAFEQLDTLFDHLPTCEQNLVNRGLHLGRVVDEYQERFEQGDFLIRNVVGFDPDAGSIVVSDYLRVGQTVQFHVRDAQTADAELRQMLAAAARRITPPAAAALAFTCNGRGTRLFAQPHHDAAAIGQVWGDIPLAGFFAAGEIGPVGGMNFLHGFTASIALFEPLTNP